MKTIEKTNVIWKLFLSIFSINMLLVLIICIMKTENNLPVSKMIILPTMFCGSLIFIGIWKEKLDTFLQKKLHVLLPAFLVGYGIVLYFVALSGRCSPVHDQAAVYQGALYFAGLSEEISWTYFARCNNNIMPMLLLSVILRIGNFVGGGILEPYYFAVLTNVFQVLLAMYCLFKLTKDRNGMLGAWISIIILGLFIPIVGHTMSLYTDSMSFSLGIVGFYFLIKNKEKTNIVLYWIKNILIGFLFGFAAVIKMTTFITVIAILIYSIIWRNKEILCKAICVLLVGSFVIFACNYFTTLLPSEAMRDFYGTPKLSYWVGIGIKGNGGYIDNQEYSAHLNSIYGMEEKEAWSKQYIKENIYEFWNKEHIIQKTRYNFANGALGCDIFVHTLDSNNLLYNLMHYNGAYYWRYTMIMTAFMYTCYILSAVNAIMNLIKKKQEASGCEVSLIVIFGIMLYLMLFEANNRQLYNHLPWFALAAACGLSDVWNCIFKKEKIKC